MKQFSILLVFLLSISCNRGTDFKKELEKTQQIIENAPAKEADSCQRAFFSQYDMPISTKELKNGSFTGSSIPDNEGYIHKVTLTVIDGIVVKANYNEWKNDIPKTADSLYCAKLDSTQKGTNPNDIFRFYEQELLVRQNILDINCISNTTKILYRVRMAASLALEQAK